MPRVHVATHLRVQFSAAGDTGRSMRKGCSGAHFRRGAACHRVANVAPGGSAGVSHARRALARARAWAVRAHLRSIISAQRLRHIFPLVFHRRPARRARRIELGVCRAAGRADRATTAHRAAHDGIRGRNRPQRKCCRSTPCKRNHALRGVPPHLRARVATAATASRCAPAYPAAADHAPRWRCAALRGSGSERDHRFPAGGGRVARARLRASGSSIAHPRAHRRHTTHPCALAALAAVPRLRAVRARPSASG